MRRSSSLPGALCPSRAAYTDWGESWNSLNSAEMAAIAAGMESGSCRWTTGISAADLIGRGSAVSMSTVKLEGVGEGMFAELTEDMLERIGWQF